MVHNFTTFKRIINFDLELYAEYFCDSKVLSSFKIDSLKYGNNWTIITAFVPQLYWVSKMIALRQQSCALCRVFCLNGTCLISHVEQHKLYSCSVCRLTKTLQGLCQKDLNFLFSKNSNSRTKNGRDVQFSPKCSKFSVAFLVKRLGA